MIVVGVATMPCHTVPWRGCCCRPRRTLNGVDWLDQQLVQAPPGTIVGGGRPDQTFNRIARHIVKAVKQFDAVNPDHSLPNVLVFVNHDDNSGYRDLCETLTGHIRADSGEVYAFMSDGLLGDKRKLIDLYVWIDDYRDRQEIRGWLMADTVP
jgi:hypothetical protein